MRGIELWKDGLICAFEFGTNVVPEKTSSAGQKDADNDQTGCMEKHTGNYWVPIGWNRITELSQRVQVDGGWPIWWCHVAADHYFTESWLHNAQWLHPDVSKPLRDESLLIKDKHLHYEVPVRVGGGVLFELLGQPVGDEEDETPFVLRSFTAQNFLISVLHAKETPSHINVKGITEVQELLAAGGTNAPRTVHELIAQLAFRLSCWDDMLFHRSIFGADEIQLKFLNRKTYEDMNLFSAALNHEISMLSRQVIRVKWLLHAREKIIFELLQHLRGNAARSLLEGIQKNTREMIKKQEAVEGRLFSIQDVVQNSVHSWLLNKRLRVTHNLTVFGGCSLILLIIARLFVISLDGKPGDRSTPDAFALFYGLLILILYLGLKKPVAGGHV